MWSFDISPDETRVVTGAADNMMRVWKVNSAALTSTLPAQASTKQDVFVIDTVGASKTSELVEVIGGSEAAANLANKGPLPAVANLTEHSGAWNVIACPCTSVFGFMSCLSSRLPLQ